MARVHPFQLLTKKKLRTTNINKLVERVLSDARSEPRYRPARERDASDAAACSCIPASVSNQASRVLLPTFVSEVMKSGLNSYAPMSLQGNCAGKIAEILSAFFRMSCGSSASDLDQYAFGSVPA